MLMKNDEHQSPESLTKYLDIAGEKTKQKSTVISRLVLSTLPEVTVGLLDEAHKLAQKQSLTNPWLAWATSFAIASAAKYQGVEKFLEARAAWNLGWAANECLEPHLAKQALSKAKQLFEQAGDSGWVAACEWQLHAVPYITTNFVTTKQALEEALIGLRSNTMGAFIGPCIQSLTFANLLINTQGTLNQAGELISEAEKIYALSGNIIGSARAKRQNAALLTRTSRYSEAIDILLKLKEEFACLDARIDLAKANFQLALNYSTMGSPIDEARSLYELARATYRSARLPLPEAECLYGLGMLKIRSGAYEEADRNFREARKVFELYAIPGLLADNLLDSGRLSRIVGNNSLALERFQRSLEINEKLGSRLQAAVAKTNLGHIYTKLGHFQSSLVYLEEASRELATMDNPGRLADCWLYLADTWVQLGQYTLALTLLDAIKENAPNALTALALEASLAKAHSLIGAQRLLEARTHILDEISRWQDSEALSDLPLFRRALGLVQYYEKDPSAEQTLQQTQAEFNNLGMAEEEASCLLLLGEIYASSERDEKAISAWQAALLRIGEGYPEIRIGCFIGLASIHEKRGQNSQAISWYRRVTHVIRETAPDFWQPSIFSFHLAKFLPDLERIFRFYLFRNLATEAHALVEKIKAHTIKQRLLKRPLRSKKQQNQIHRLREALEVSREESEFQSQRDSWLVNIARSQASYARLVPILDSIENQYGYIERDGLKAAGKRATDFQINRFRAVANQRLGRNWTALDYYMTDHEVVLAMVTPDLHQVTSRKLTPRLKIALSTVGLGKTSNIFSNADLELLARELLPQEVLSKKNKKSLLLISPHKTLWSIPWAGLPLSGGSNHLVDAFYIATIPSLESLMILWKRSRSRGIHTGLRGGFIGLSNFKGNQINLPFVQNELDYLNSQKTIELKYLLNERATRKNVLGLLEKHGQPAHRKFDFLHLATHIQYEQRSNLLCTIELEDGRFWSEELFDSCNLPHLVYLSACNGASSFAFEGGEQIGLPLTLLTNGANTVIGSWAAISDKAALQLTVSFYEQITQNKQPVAIALANAQQQARNSHMRFSDWAYVSCVGIPDLALG